MRITAQEAKVLAAALRASLRADPVPAALSIEKRRDAALLARLEEFAS